MQPPWFAPRWWWAGNFEVGVRSHWLATNAAAHLLCAQPGAAVFFTSERQPDIPGLQELVLDLRGTAVARMALLYALHFRPHAVSSILLYPGFSRTDTIQRNFDDDNDYSRAGPRRFLLAYRIHPLRRTCSRGTRRRPRPARPNGHSRHFTRRCDRIRLHRHQRHPTRPAVNGSPPGQAGREARRSL